MPHDSLTALCAETSNTTSSLPLPQVAVRAVVAGLSRVLPKLILFLQSQPVRDHTTWGKLIPYDISNHGGGKRSIGHCVGIDLIVSREGVFVSEFDFAPSGRGFMLASLPPHGVEATLRTFADWYKSMRLPEHPDTELAYYYATATRTSCWEETSYFCRHLREHGVTIDPVNMDELSEKGEPLTRIVDRLFYTSELVSEKNTPKCRMITKEPFLDSKMIAALIHDSYMTMTLTEALGEQDLSFLRRVVPETYALDIVRARYPDMLTRVATDTNRYDWLIKNTDVETDDSWGSRGVVFGGNYTKAQFTAALLEGVSPKNKNIGRHPVLQRFHRSTDFMQTWNDVVEGNLHAPDQSVFGRAVDPEAVGTAAKKPVHGRLRPYILIDQVNARTFTPPYAVGTLRQDVLSHGASDALFVAFEIV